MSAFTEPSRVPIHSPTTGTSCSTTGTTRTSGGGGGGGSFRAQPRIASETNIRKRRRSVNGCSFSKRMPRSDCIENEHGDGAPGGGGAHGGRAYTTFSADLGHLPSRKVLIAPNTVRGASIHGA